VSALIGVFQPHPVPLQKRVALLADRFATQARWVTSEEQVLEQEALLASCEIFFVFVGDLKKESEMSSRVQAIKYAAQNSFLVVVGDRKISPEGAEFLKKSGANLVIPQNEFEETMIPEYLCSYRLHNFWLPIKSSELRVGVILPFHIYHFMPLNRKFLPLATKGSSIDQAKWEKAQKIGEFYVPRDELAVLSQFLKNHQDQSAQGLASRCRSQYMLTHASLKNFILHLFDHSEQSQFERGKKLLEEATRIADAFVLTLGALGDAWAVINQAAFDEVTPMDHSTSVAAQASLLSLILGIGNPTEVFLLSVFADLGLLEMRAETLSGLICGDKTTWTGQDHELYQKHSELSVQRLLSRKIPLSDKQRTIILATHERVDGKGFPHAWKGAKIPKESQLIQIAEEFDRRGKVRAGEKRKDPVQSRQEALQSLMQDHAVDQALLTQVKAALA